MCFTTLPSRERILLLFTINCYFCEFHLLNALYLFSKGWEASHRYAHLLFQVQPQGEAQDQICQLSRLFTLRNAFRAVFRISHTAPLGENPKYIQALQSAHGTLPCRVCKEVSICGLYVPRYPISSCSDFAWLRAGVWDGLHSGCQHTRMCPPWHMRLVDKPQDNDNVKSWSKVHLILQGLPKAHLTSLSLWDLSNIHLMQYSASSCCCGKERLRNV